MLNRVGKYALKRKLGKGASGTVYLGVDTFSHTEVLPSMLMPIT